MKMQASILKQAQKLSLFNLRFRRLQFLQQDIFLCLRRPGRFFPLLHLLGRHISLLLKLLGRFQNELDGGSRADANGGQDTRQTDTPRAPPNSSCRERKVYVSI